MELQGFQESTLPNPHTLNHCLFAKLNYCLCSFLPSYSSRNHPLFPSFSHAWLPAFPLAGTPSPTPDAQDYHRQRKPIPLQLCSLQPGPHTGRGMGSCPHWFPHCVYSAHWAAGSAGGQVLLCPAEIQGYRKDAFSAFLEQYRALGISAQNVIPLLKPVNTRVLW